MTIIKTKDFVETYRAKAGSKDINELTGRTGRPDLTRFVIQQMVSKIPVAENSILVDIGCGDGLFLKEIGKMKLDSYKGRLIGILPTKEEVTRVRNHMLNDDEVSRQLISIELGLAEKTNLPDNFADVVVCNGVLLGAGQTIENTKAALTEFYRITKVGGCIFIGEMPDTNEMAGKTYNDSIVSWLYWVWKNQGAAQFWIRLKQTLTALFSNEPFIIYPKNMFFMPPNEFIALLSAHGIDVIEHYRHKEIDTTKNIYESKTRWNYIGIKIN